MYIYKLEIGMLLLTSLDNIKLLLEHNVVSTYLM